MVYSFLYLNLTRRKEPIPWQLKWSQGESNFNKGKLQCILMREIKAIQLWMAISRRPNLSDSTIHAFPHVIWLTKTNFTLFNNSMSTSLLLCSHSQTLLNASVAEQIYKYPCRCTPSISESCAKEERRTEKGAKLKQ